MKGDVIDHEWNLRTGEDGGNIINYFIDILIQVLWHSEGGIRTMEKCSSAEAVGSIPNHTKPYNTDWHVEHIRDV